MRARTQRRSSTSSCAYMGRVEGGTAKAVGSEADRKGPLVGRENVHSCRGAAYSKHR